MRILHIVGTLNAGGIERVVTELAIAQKQQGYCPAVCCISRREGLFLDVLSRYGVPVFDASTDGPPYRLVRTLYPLTKSFKPDVVHCHVNYSLLWLVKGSMTPKQVPFIVTQHSLMNVSHLDRIRSRFLYRLARPYISAFTAVSEYAARYASWLYGLPVQEVLVIYNGVDAYRFRFNPELRSEFRQKWRIPENAFLWGSIGRIDRVKGYDILLEAFSQALHRNSQIWLALVGRGNLEAQLSSRAEQLGCSSRVIWVGECENIAGVLSAFDGYVQPSRRESLSMSILEALANGLPIVATQVGGIEEIGLRTSAVHLVPPEDHIALATWLRSVDFFRGFNPGRESLLPNAFSFQRMFEAYDCLYQRLCYD